MRETGRGSSSSEHVRNGSVGDSLEGGVSPDASPNYQPEMDEMRCILYAHGGKFIGIFQAASIPISPKAVITLVVSTRNDMPSNGLLGR